jgi:hypothetical protein
VQSSQGRPSGGLEIAKYALFLDLNPTTNSSAVFVTRRPHAVVRQRRTRESDAPRRGSGLGLDQIFLPWACVEKETYGDNKERSEGERAALRIVCQSANPIQSDPDPEAIRSGDCRHRMASGLDSSVTTININIAAILRRK